jgi:Protein of unknown function (DUF2804)
MPPSGSGWGRAPGSPARLLRGTRPLKRWRYVGVFNEQLMACAALVCVGPARQSFWALYLRERGELRGRTRVLPRAHELRLEPGRLLLRDRDVALDLALREDAGFTAFCKHGREHVWTRKQAGVDAHGTLALDGRAPLALDARAVIDETTGYHARRTEWFWSAGVGRGPDGAALAWNLVCGVNDPPHGSERAVWIDGEPHEAPAVAFSRDLLAIRGSDGSELRFTPEAERAHRHSLLVLKSDYRAPFGTFSGILPGGVELVHGLGVVEWHRALW